MRKKHLKRAVDNSSPSLGSTPRQNKPTKKKEQWATAALETNYSKSSGQLQPWAKESPRKPHIFWNHPLWTLQVCLCSGGRIGTWTPLRGMQQRVQAMMTTRELSSHTVHTCPMSAPACCMGPPRPPPGPSSATPASTNLPHLPLQALVHSVLCMSHSLSPQKLTFAGCAAPAASSQVPVKYPGMSSEGRDGLLANGLLHSGASVTLATMVT